MPSSVAADTRSNALGNVNDALNAVLADCYALFLKTKNFHWHVSGPHFREYHLLFDEQATEILGMTDAVAERVRKNGGTTLRSVGHIARLQRIEDNDAAAMSAREMVSELHSDNQKLAESLREAKRLADEAGDNATSGVLDDWSDQTEQRTWFLYETMQKG